MTALAGTVIAERWLDEVIIGASASNVDGDVSDSVSLPSGFGDCAIMEMAVDGGPAATLVTNAELKGGRFTIMDKTGTTIIDIVGTANRWSLRGAASAWIYVSPDPLVLWRQDELLVGVWPELDTNAAPTIDYVWRIKVVRVRPSAQGADAPAREFRLTR